MKERIRCAINHRYSKFLMGGIIVFIFEWILTVLLTEIFYFGHNLSYVFSLLLGLILLFSFHEKITFRANIVNRKLVLKKFFWIYSIAFLINWILVFYFSRHIHYAIAIPVVTAFLSFVLYPINKRWIFGCSN